MKAQKTIEIMDTTLRDGEQTSGVSFCAAEKLNIARLLLETLKVDRVEIASARVSEGEMEGVAKVTAWAAKKGWLDRVEVLGFVDGGISLDWIKQAGGRVINLLSKGSLNHCIHQIGKQPGEHWNDIAHAVALAEEKGISVNLYLEDWSNGMLSSPEYVYGMLDSLKDLPIKRFMLPDTLGVLNPFSTYELCKDIVGRYPELRFDFHAHNDYDLGVANTMAAAKAGIHGVHATINGLGERAGNAPLPSVVAVLHDQLNIRTSVQEQEINNVSRIVESSTGLLIPPNKPIVGAHVFTQCAGIHADGDNKKNLYFNALLPERFGRQREYALGKTSGKANIRKNLEMLGINLDEDAMKKVTERVIELGDKKEVVTSDDLPYIISDVLGQEDDSQKVRILNYSLNLAQGLSPVATVKISYEGKDYQETSIGDGQYDAFMRAVEKIYKHHLKKSFPVLENYAVTIPPGGGTDAVVQTMISWNYEGRTWRTHGLDADQAESAIKATISMLNRIGL